MDKKNIVITAKLIPVISAVLSYLLILGPFRAAWISKVTGVTVILAFLGVVFFFIGRRMAKENKAVKILGILDILSTVSMIALYALAVISVAL